MIKNVPIFFYSEGGETPVALDIPSTSLSEEWQERYYKFQIKAELNNTYSEAMLISGASKQISLAILCNWDFYNLI